MGSYIVRNAYGAFCSICQSPLSLEEDDFDTCDACGERYPVGASILYDSITEEVTGLTCGCGLGYLTPEEAGDYITQLSPEQAAKLENAGKVDHRA